jgi:hypothetical protein
MKKFIFKLALCFNTSLSFAAQWIVLNPTDIENLQIVQANNSNGSPEGLYINLKANLTGEAATYCTRKDFVFIRDPKLIDRVYSGIMYASSSQKTVQLYLDGTGNCVFNIPVATMFMLLKP